ncbi:unnamed protein product, partial [Cladocopium goreaui]
HTFCSGQSHDLRKSVVNSALAMRAVQLGRCAHLWAMAAMAVTSFRAHRVAGISGRVGMRKSFQ